ncbi:MAG: 3-hydroxybutyryl-CoA dehydrogenase [Clostridia bacterium]|nr:3-hydroxybutyryl-CoA dehydrogenase [Clostridia bacterium]
MQIQKVLVVGAGVMGGGIAQLIAQAGLQAILSDIDETIVKKSLDKTQKGLEGRVAKGKMTPSEVEQIMSRITPSVGIEKAEEIDFVIEAIIEDIEAKKKLFAELDKVAPPHAILASNTTSCSITEIASATNRPEKVVGMHFFNPPVVMKLVEIMPGLRTDPETLEITKELAEKLGKTVVTTRTEGPAGIASRVLAGMLNEAVWVLAEGIGGVEEIDKAMKLGSNLPMGPLELIDLIGIDVHLAKTKTLYEKLGDPRYRPCYLLEKMLKAGYLGRKSGKGFYDYTQDPPVPLKF